jgi:hypothetical protein
MRLDAWKRRAEGSRKPLAVSLPANPTDKRSSVALTMKRLSGSGGGPGRDRTGDIRVMSSTKAVREQSRPFVALLVAPSFRPISNILEWAGTEALGE